VEPQGSGAWLLRFTGQSLALQGIGAPLEVAVDGGTPVALPPGAEQVIVASGLAEGDHTAVVRGERPPDAFLVGREQPLAWAWWLTPALLTVALAVVGALAMGRVLSAEY
jgi:hypothetical protein